MGIAKSLVIGSLFVITVACSHENHEEHGDISSEERKTVNSDLRIPSKLWDLIEEKVVIEHGQIALRHEGGEGPVALTDAENIFSSVRVEFREKGDGVLTKSAFEINGKIGLILDLADYVRGETGTFNLKIDPGFELDPARTKVYFVSRARRRKVDGQILGAGCNKFMDISEYYFKSMRSGGLDVNVYRSRQASLLGGYFLFTGGADAGIRQITQVAFTDSRYPQYRCGVEL